MISQLPEKKFHKIHTTNEPVDIEIGNVSSFDEDVKVLAVKDGYRLKKNLKARHISMIAIGGALGTGLLIGSGAALNTSGPAALFIGYGFIGFIVYIVMCCIGEMATYIPQPEGFLGIPPDIVIQL